MAGQVGTRTCEVGVATRHFASPTSKVGGRNLEVAYPNLQSRATTCEVVLPTREVGHPTWYFRPSTYHFLPSTCQTGHRNRRKRAFSAQFGMEALPSRANTYSRGGRAPG